MAVYKVVLNGSAFGQAVNNILYYRDGIGVDLGGLTLGGTELLAHLVKDTVWPKMKPIVSSNYTLDTLTVYKFHTDTYELVYQNPFQLPVGEAGTDSAECDGIANCWVIRMNLEPTVIGPNGIKPPKRGYLAVGPVASGNIDNTGHVVGTIFNNEAEQIYQFCAAISENLESVLPPALYFPVRVHQDNILGVHKILSYADVTSATLRRLTSFRRSRQLEI